MVLGVKEIGKVHGGRLSVEATFLGWSDPQYLWWMESGEGKDQKDQRTSVEIAHEPECSHV